MSTKKISGHFADLSDRSRLVGQEGITTRLLLTSNPPFSKWEGIFKDPITTAAAIDRLVHHSIIVELNIPSYRLEQARNNVQALGEELPLPPGAAEAAGGGGRSPEPEAASAKEEVNAVSS